MFALSSLPLLFAADNRLIKLGVDRWGTEAFSIPVLPAIVLVTIVLAFAFGIWFASAVRMKDYGWKVGLILASFAVALAVVLLGQYKLGVDLQGGVTFVYEVNEERTNALNPEGQPAQWSMSRLVQVIGERLNETGLKEIVVRPFGPKQIEIVVPEVDPAEIEELERKITSGGTLEFMIVASENKDAQLFELARAQAARQSVRLQRQVVDEDGVVRGFWARVGREQIKGQDEEDAPFRDPSIAAGLLRDSRTGEVLDLSREQKLQLQSSGALSAYLKQRDIKRIDALMVYDEEYSIKGEDLGSASPGRDKDLRPCIFFTMRGEGIYKMGALTAANIERKLAIIFDNEMKSAPNIQEKISERGEITGKFSVEEVQFVVDILKSGSLPVMLHEKPISKNTIGAILGRDTIESGSRAIIWALSAVLIFLIAYYRFAGLVAGLALTLNILLTVAFMVAFQAPFTLPGLAGLVLTVGMSVDANVLIFERMREEQQRGATLRMTIRNGFDRALSAIIDGNLTTLFTAIVLYWLGTDQVRGFGATLILGNITSMFTAIFCSRVVFDIAEKTRWLTRLSMAQLMSPPSIDWCRYLVPSMVVSTILLLVGLGATVARGRGIFDIDLAGGTSVTFILKKAQPDDQVRQRLGAVLDKLVDPTTKGVVSWSVNEVQVRTETPQTVYRVDSSLPEVTDLQAKIREAFRENGQEGLKTFQMAVGKITQSEVKPPPSTGPPAGGPSIGPANTGPTFGIPPIAPPRTTPAPPATTPATAPERSTPVPDDAANPDSSGCQEEPTTPPATKAEEDTDAKTKSVPAVTPAETSPETPELSKPGPTAPPTSPPTTLPFADPVIGAAESTPPVLAGPAYETTVVLDFPQSAISERALRERVLKAAGAALGREPQFELDNPEWFKQDNSAFEQWTLKIALPQADTQKLLARMEQELESDVVWQTSSKIGGQVSVDTRWRAVGAIAVSLVLILSYIWFRFHQAIWGIAAIVAIAHDALVMLGGIAVSYWLVGMFDWLLIEEFKISLPVVAAFLTLLGYSVNDTIVIFDRIREIRGKSPDLTEKMINDSVNQTLSRTIITGGLVLMVVLVLYFFGGSGIHAFAFSLVIGVISGTYSTVFIAAPLLLWLLGKPATQPAKSGAREMAKTA